MPPPVNRKAELVQRLCGNFPSGYLVCNLLKLHWNIGRHAAFSSGIYDQTLAAVHHVFHPRAILLMSGLPGFRLLNNEGARPAAVGVNYLVDLRHDADCFAESDDDLLVVHDVRL